MALPLATEELLRDGQISMRVRTRRKRHDARSAGGERNLDRRRFLGYSAGAATLAALAVPSVAEAQQEASGPTQSGSGPDVVCDTMVVYRLQSSWDTPRGPHGKTELNSNASKTAAAHRWALTEKDALDMNLHKCSWAPAEAVVVAREPFMEIWSSNHAGSYTWENPWNGSSPRIYDSRCLEHLEGGDELWAAAMNPPCVAGAMADGITATRVVAGPAATATPTATAVAAATPTAAVAVATPTATAVAAATPTATARAVAAATPTATARAVAIATPTATAQAVVRTTPTATAAAVPTATPTATAAAAGEFSDDLPAQLAFTGSDSTVLAGAGIAMVVVGAISVRAARMEKIRLAKIEARTDR